MSLQIFALLLMVISFTALGVWVYHPRQKRRWNQLANIPLEDNDTSSNQPGESL